MQTRNLWATQKICVLTHGHAKCMRWWCIPLYLHDIPPPHPRKCKHLSNLLHSTGYMMYCAIPGYTQMAFRACSRSKNSATNEGPGLPSHDRIEIRTGYGARGCKKTVQAIWCTVQSRGIHKWLFHLCMPLMCPGKWWCIRMLRRLMWRTSFITPTFTGAHDNKATCKRLISHKCFPKGHLGKFFHTLIF